MKAVCTWGDGPDVLVDLNNTTVALYEAPWSDPPPRGRWAHGCISEGSFDLTAEEAKALAAELINAAEQADHLTKSYKDHCEAMAETDRMIKWNNIECESCGGAHYTVECDKTYKLKP